MLSPIVKPATKPKKRKDGPSLQQMLARHSAMFSGSHTLSMESVTFFPNAKVKKF